MLRCDAAALAGFLDDRRHGRVGGTTAVFDRAGRALYFSKEVIPLHRPRRSRPARTIPVFHHVGVYAYRRDPLLRYADLAEGPLETWEGLEQLRFMENGVAGPLRRGRRARAAPSGSSTIPRMSRGSRRSFARSGSHERGSFPATIGVRR